MSGIAIGFVGLFFAQVFALTTMRRLRKIPHRSTSFEAQDLYSGADIAAVSAYASTPKWWRDYNERKGKPILNEKYEWVMANTKRWERVLARITFALTSGGCLMIVIGLVIQKIVDNF